MLEIDHLYVWDTKSGEKIHLIKNKILAKDKEWFSEYLRYYFDIKNISDQIMWVFVLDRNVATDWDKYYDVGWIDIEKYWYAKQWIASAVYRHINQELIKQTWYHLYSDRTKLSPEAKWLRKYLLERWDAELVWIFPTGEDWEDVTLYRMK